MVRQAVAEGLRPALAGQDRSAVEALAAATGLEGRAFDLKDPGGVAAGIDGMDAVLHCAGPFIHTARPMVDACLRAGVHYLDVTGEISVFEALAARDGEARSADVVLLPGVGFDVVPTDCLAAHLIRRLPEAEWLALGFLSTGGVSRGTALTALERVGRRPVVRRNGRLVTAARGERRRSIDFGDGPRTAVAIPWGDLATAPRSTGIQDVAVYMAMPRWTRRGLAAARLAAPLLRTAPVRRGLEGWIRRRQRGPDAAARARGRTVVWAEVRAADGARAASRLYGPEGYTFTARAAVAAFLGVLEGTVEGGFRTPSLAFGPDFVLGLDGVRREDLEGPENTDGRDTSEGPEQIGG